MIRFDNVTTELLQEWRETVGGDRVIIMMGHHVFHNMVISKNFAEDFEPSTKDQILNEGVLGYWKGMVVVSDAPFGSHILGSRDMVMVMGTNVEANGRNITKMQDASPVVVEGQMIGPLITPE